MVQSHPDFKSAAGRDSYSVPLLSEDENNTRRMHRPRVNMPWQGRDHGVQQNHLNVESFMTSESPCHSESQEDWIISILTAAMEITSTSEADFAGNGVGESSSSSAVA